MSSYYGLLMEQIAANHSEFCTVVRMLTAAAAANNRVIRVRCSDISLRRSLLSPHIYFNFLKLGILILRASDFKTKFTPSSFDSLLGSRFFSN